MKFLIGYILLINMIGFILMYIDKQRARKRTYRIPEARLWGVALVGGAFGAAIGMRLFRHKTKHRSFTFGFPLLILLNLVMILFIANQYLI